MFSSTTESLGTQYTGTLAARAIGVLLEGRECVTYHLYTAFLFTRSDFKTILFPVSAFACAVAPVHSTSRLLLGMLWIWSHQFMCNVSNQARSCDEDAINKPWRPLPSGRITDAQARVLRWIAVLFCGAISALFGPDLVLVTLGLLITTFLYDEMGFASHHIGKNLCNIGGYTSIELGATKVMGITRELDNVSIFAVSLSGVLIFTTIQAQDFADVEGDSAMGRVTFPIYAPELSRVFTLLALIGWSCALSVFWDIGHFHCAAFVALGGLVGWRYYALRTSEEDDRSYILYNIWLTIAHILPVHARVGILKY